MRTSIVETDATPNKWPPGMFLEKQLITVWLTFPLADGGIEEVVAEEPSQDGLLLTFCGGLRCGYSDCRENILWHRTKEAAIAQANKFRCARVDKAHAEIARLLALPPIGGGP